jgi:predicted Zn-dependent protease
LVTLLRGINGYYSGDGVGSLRRFRAVLQSGDETGNDDVRRIIVKQTFPAQVLAAFYAGQAASEDGRSSEAALNLARTLASWRAELLRQPSLATWADLLSAIDLHTSRTASAGAERNLVALVTQEVLEPIIRLNRAARQVQLGDLESARQELAEAARRVEDRDGRRRLQQAIEELDGWNQTQR